MSDCDTSACKIIDNEAAELYKKLTSLLEKLGLEAYPFKIGWYNNEVKPAFHFAYHPDTLAFVILSIPSMYEKGFKPFLEKIDCLSTKDPLDQCMTLHFQKIKGEFPTYDIETMHDFELHPNRRPKILVQTAGHVSGAAYYYQKGEVKNPPWDNKKRIFGVSIHPTFGGWFAFRGAVIFKNVQVPFLIQKPPIDIVESEEKKIELLEKFNTNWEDWSYRDITNPDQKYSMEQKAYFSTPPSKRFELLKDFGTATDRTL